MKNKYKYYDKNKLVHRRVYAQQVGPLLPGHVIHHTCQDPSCLDPSHLQQVTRSKHLSMHLTGYTQPSKRRDHGRVELAYVPAFKAEEEFSKTLTVVQKRKEARNSQ